jgi:hypothetical protein
MGDGRFKYRLCLPAAGRGSALCGGANFSKNGLKYLTDTDIALLGEKLFERAAKNIVDATEKGIKVSTHSYVPQFDDVLSVNFSDIDDFSADLLNLVMNTNTRNMNDKMITYTVDNVQKRGLKFGEFQKEQDYRAASVLAVQKLVDEGLVKVPEYLSRSQKLEMYREVYEVLENRIRVGKKEAIEGLALTWHHHEDLKTMQLIPTGIHSFSHTGGDKIAEILRLNKASQSVWQTYIGKTSPHYYF